MVKVGAKSAAWTYYENVKTKEREGLLDLTPRQRVLFSALADQRLIYARTHLKRLIDDTARIRRWNAVFGHFDVTTITPALIERELDAMREQGYEIATVLRYVATLHDRGRTPRVVGLESARQARNATVSPQFEGRSNPEAIS